MTKITLLVLMAMEAFAGVGGTVADAPNYCDKYKITNTTVALTQTVVVQANPYRKGMRIYNNSSNSVYLSVGTTCDSANTLFAIVATYSAFEFASVNYRGAVCALRNSGTGNVVVTEFY